jgi:hemerythrin superfamily protein
MPTTAIEMLKEDHAKVKSLLEQLTDTTDRAEKKRQDLLDKIERELAIHTQLEEEVFYPAFRDANGSKNKAMYFEAVEEHRAVEKLVLPDLKKTDPTSAKFAGRAKVLRELVEHHVKEEEQEMFPEAESVMGKETLEDLAQRMEARRKELKKAS